ncbi:NAD(+) synthase [Dehalobacterium formicoaceticum]|uniref:NAD(+) synthase n=1 Tax=Dehalobacterium formicoaceticum TaxID=51515 RepID=UPI000B7F4138|nr:NAD(+) synthase [Dehalobacterium formicoaceticum]
MKIALGQMQVVPGRPDLNTQTMKKMIREAKDQGAELIIFPELCIPGYLLGDTWEQSSYLSDCVSWGQEIIQLSRDICIVFGNVAVDWERRGADGRVRKYNACFFAYQGKLWGDDNFPYPYRIKTDNSDYRLFDDSRHFFSLSQFAAEEKMDIQQLFQPVHLILNNQPLRLGCLLGEDGRDDDDILKQRMAATLQNSPVNLFINIASSPFASGKNYQRNRILSRQVKEWGVPFAYVNHTGIQNNGKNILPYDGVSSFYDGQGELVDLCAPFTPDLKIIDYAAREDIGVPKPKIPDDRGIKAIYQALTYGTKWFLDSIGMKKVVIGLSGGIDSALNACLYTLILGHENILLVNMPSIYNSETTKGLAYQLAENLGCYYAVFPIQEAVDYTVKQIEGTPIIHLSGKNEINLAVSSFVKENIQARDRSARILASLSAIFGGGFTCNANKSEATVGYATLYGDQAGFLAALGDLWKHQVYDLAQYVNREIFGTEVIPQQMIDLVPSAELSPMQNVDEGKGDPIRYPYHDYLFRAFIEPWERKTPEDILAWYQQGILEEKIGCQPGLIKSIFPEDKDFIDDLEYWWKQYTGMGAAKRIQAPPILALSPRAFGLDHREAQNGSYFTKKYAQLKQDILVSGGDSCIPS